MDRRGAADELGQGCDSVGELARRLVTILYTRLASVYHELYQSIFDYKRDFRVLHAILKKHRSMRVLEIGCGAGNLAPMFLDAGYDYIGMDRAEPMLRIARQEVPAARFLRGDMRGFSMRRKVDAVVIAGRSFTYMTGNQDVRNALRCVRSALRPGGLLILDNFDAERIFHDFDKPLPDERFRTSERTITRRSERAMNLKTGWTWNWDAVYEVEEGGRTKTYRDHSVLRAFTRDEMRLFLELAGFTVASCRRGPASFLMIARAS